MTADAPFRIIIVGGGICGLSVAVALRSPDRSITVLEQSRMKREVGALISLQPNASRIATQFGLDKFLADKLPTTDKAFQIYNPKGELVSKILLDSNPGTGDRKIFHRVDLHESLKQAAIAEDGRSLPVQIVLASRVVDCDPQQGKVTVEGGESYSGDLIVGADGIHSIMRSFVLQPSDDKSLYDPKPTGVSAYRLLLPTKRILEGIPSIKDHIDPEAPLTHMLFGHNQRVIMGPAREGAVFGITALVPDEKMHESSMESRSWTSAGSLDKLLATFVDFPQWLRDIFSLTANKPSQEASGTEEAPELALWQLRDTEPLPRWSTGRLVLAGDACHAMLPTQGQGASQAFEDAEAIQAFLADIQPGEATTKPTLSDIEGMAGRYFRCRYERASLIQAYSRQQGLKPGLTDKKVTLDPAEFMQYNTNYQGAKDWESRQKSQPRTDNASSEA